MFTKAQYLQYIQRRSINEAEIPEIIQDFDPQDIDLGPIRDLGLGFGGQSTRPNLPTENGPIYTMNPDGSITITWPGGEVTIVHPDGTVEGFTPDGSYVLTHPNGQTQIWFPDGTYVVTDPDGYTTIIHPDGTVEVFHPNLPPIPDFNGPIPPDFPRPIQGPPSDLG